MSELDREDLPREIQDYPKKDDICSSEDLSQEALQTDEMDEEELPADLFEQMAEHLSQPGIYSLVEEFIEKNLEHIWTIYAKATHLKEQGLFEEALEEIDGLVSKIMPITEYIQSEADVQSFSELFELDLFEMLEPSRQLHQSPIPSCDLLSLHGSLLLILGRTEEAITSLGHALAWNPVSHNASILLAEAYKTNEDMDMLYALTIDRFSTAFSRIHMAELYFNLGYYYGKTEQPEDARACFTLSSRYGGKEIAAGALYQLGKMYGKSFQWANDEQLEQSSKACGYPLVPDEKIIQLARFNATESYLDGDYDRANYYIRIAYDLSGSTEDQSFMDMLAEKNIVM